MNEKAKESVQVQKARKKIEQKLLKAEKKMSPEALQLMSKIIKEQLSRKKEGRINLKDRQISFDENKHSAKIESRFIMKLIQQIQTSQNEI